MVGMWIWNTHEVIGTAAARTTLVQYLADNNIAKVYMFLDRALPQSAYREFMAASDVEVYALEGDASYIAPEHRSNVVSIVQWVADFNAANTPQRFCGIQFDIEPYQLPEWHTQQDELARLWVETIDLFVSTTKILDGNLQTSAAVPFWIDTVMFHGISVFDWMLTGLDEAALMSYRNNGADVLAIAQSKLEIAEKYGKRVILGIETTNVQPAYITFYGKTKTCVETEISVIFRSVKSNTFGGVAIHDYTGCCALK